MNTPTVLRHGGLDFRALTAELPDGPGPWRVVWSLQLSVMPGRSRLLDLAGEPVLLNAPSGIIALGADPPGPERLLAGARLVARPGIEGGALLFDEPGNFYRWAPGELPRKIWETEAPWSEVEAIALTKGRLLVQRPLKDGQFITELIQPETGVRWQATGDLRGVLPWDESLFVVSSERSSVARLHESDGTQKWNQPIAGRVSSLLAMVAERLWLTTYDAEIVGLDTDTGRIEARLKVPLTAVPEGVVDEAGRLHVCHGASYTVLDLTAGGATIASSELPGGDDGPSLVFGTAAIPTRDGRLVFFDRNGGVFTARAGQTAAPDLLWRSCVPLLDCRAGKGILFVLDREGMLAALSP